MLLPMMSVTGEKALNHASMPVQTAPPGRTRLSEFVMLKNFAILTAVCALAIGCVGLHAEDLLPRACNGFAAGGDGLNVIPAPPGGASAMTDRSTSESYSEHAAEPAVESTERRVTQRNRVATDSTRDSAPSVPAAADGNSTPTAAASTAAPVTTTAHKNRTGLRWQSLLPGVVK